MSEITAADRAHIVSARGARALLDIEGRRVSASQGTVFIGCPDGDRFKDVYDYHCHVCNGVRHHPLLLNGGALLLSHHSPIWGAKGDGKTLVRHANAAARIKHIHTAILYAHWPCGVGVAAGLNFLEVLRLLLEAKMRLRSQRGFTNIKKFCFVHVDYGDRKRTYFVDRQVAEGFLKERGSEVRMQ